MITSSLAASTGSKRLKAAAFTLLELLVVISIIAVLAGILLPVSGAVMESAKKTSAKSTESQIIAAVKSFQTDYGVYPALPSVPAANPPTDTTVGGTTSISNADLFAVLRATDTATSSSNTRRIVYFEGKDVKNSGRPTDGFVPNGATLTGVNGNTIHVGSLVDPWGSEFFICYDSGYTDQVNHPYVSTPSTNSDDGGAQYDPTKYLRVGVIAWSYGKDGKKGTNGTVSGTAPSFSYGDDVVSWQ